MELSYHVCCRPLGKEFKTCSTDAVCHSGKTLMVRNSSGSALLIKAKVHAYRNNDQYCIGCGHKTALFLARFKSNTKFTSYLLRKFLVRKLFQGEQILQLNFLV